MMLDQIPPLLESNPQSFFPSSHDRLPHITRRSQNLSAAPLIVSRDTLDRSMPKDTLAIQAEQRILILRDQKVMLDFHLAELYGVETRDLKQAVRRNPEGFPEDFD